MLLKSPPPPAFIYLMPLLFPVLWILVTFAISRMGWHALAERYQTRELFYGKKTGLLTASINWSNYKNSLLLQYNEAGMHLQPVVIFRLFHPPVLIPWSEIKKVTHTQFLFAKSTELIIGEPKVAKIMIPQKRYLQMQHDYPQYLQA